MIKELTTDEIKIIEDYIRLMSFYYPYYFMGEPTKYSEHGFLISGNYYVNLQKSDDDRMFLGICRLGVERNLSELVGLFQVILKKYKKIYVWTYKNNINVVELLKKARDFLTRKGIKIQEYGTDIIFYEFEEVE